MVKSMTGYGKAEVNTPGKKFTVEIRSLNSKQLDLAVKIPSLYRQAEYDIRNFASKALQRGKVDLQVSVTSEDGANNVNINEELFSAYYKKLAQIAAAQGMGWNASVLDAAVMQAILRMPDVVSNDSVVISDDERKALVQAVESAIIHLDEFREREGASLMADLLARVEKIRTLKNNVTPYETARCEVIKSRIRESIEAAAVAVDSNRLEQEMVYYIEKLDITEEKVRLENHCIYFAEVAGEEEGVGRKLGFIAQEMGREINTLGSKANDADIQRIVVQMKDELEKIKEQLLNIL